MTYGKKTGGRKKGTPNEMSRTLKDMILAALNSQEGEGVGYLTRQAQENPTAFMTLLGKILPLQVSGEGGGPLQVQDITSLSDEELILIAVGHN